MIDGHAIIIMTIFVNVLSAEDFHLYILLRDFGDNNGATCNPFERKFNNPFERE